MPTKIDIEKGRQPLKRPFFSNSIEELEATYDAGASDAKTCNALLRELTHRSTPRAVRLHEKITSARMPISIPTREPVSEPGSSPPSVTTNMPPEVIQPPQTLDAIPKSPIPAPRQQPGPKPAVSNNPEDILRAWTALEVLAPQGYKREVDLVGGRSKMIAHFDGDLPWEREERPPPKKRLYYELIVGTIELGPTVEKLLELYADDRPDMPKSSRKSPIASLLLDKTGCPLDEDTSFAISSFAWGVPIALQGDLKQLANWTLCEGDLIKEFKERVIKRNRDGDILPLTKTHIKAIYDYLVEVLQLHGHEVSPPSFAVRRHEYFASRVPPEPGLLNSFFLKDLAKARGLARTSKLPLALAHYLGVQKPEQKIDLLDDTTGLQHLLQPALTPLGRWPGNGRFPLALLQQAAVNATTEKITETGIVSVNGPPGTGKTTLLRDIVAARIIERAEVMSTFSNPATAFTPTKQTLQRQGAKIILHELDDRLKGFEMVVASSNNKAVENVSAELPALDAIAADAPELRYFQAISDNVLGIETWGLISAVLGNASNRYQFSQGFWRDEEHGLSTLLNYICGVPQVTSEPQDDGGVIKRPRHVISKESPPRNTRQAKERWQTAKAEFEKVLVASRNTQLRLQAIHEELEKHLYLSKKIAENKRELVIQKDEFESICAGLPAIDKTRSDLHASLNASNRRLHTHSFGRPGFFARLFGTQAARRWSAEFKRIEAEIESFKQGVEKNSAALRVQNTRIEKANQAVSNTQIELDRNERSYIELQERLSHRSAQIGARIPDWNFFAGDHEDTQIANLWFDQAASVERDLVFEKAIALHRAFIECAADPIRQNVSVFIESFGTRSLGKPEKDSLFADLWSTFFLIVPVVSTTFASVTNMFSKIPPETLGWLLVDEAGQALPQAAIGALMRCKKAVVVGDPLQIEPVVTLPHKLTEEICGFFGIDPLKYNAPEASVQTVADMASPYSARFPIGSGYRDVGAPLLVHRRCDSPMFDISNEIAYSNLMVQAKKPSGKDRPLGRSCWFDVVGTPGPDKWCEDEAVKLIELLGHLRASGANPDLYIVTPFVIVQDNLRRSLLNSKILDGWVEIAPWKWVSEHVGTVHTVQGREADTVFFVLGAQMSSQNGARAWAGGKPNLVNVAVTRAKSSLYVIGNRELWKSSGYFSTVDRFLPN